MARLEVGVDCCRVCSDTEIRILGRFDKPMNVIYTGVDALRYARGRRVKVEFASGIDKEAITLLTKIVELYNRSLH